MPTSTRFVVSIHVLTLLADRGSRPLRSEDLAVELGTNAAVVRALLSRLAGTGLTMSQLGNGGGALLAKPAAAISLLDVYLAVEDRGMFSFHRSKPEGKHPVGQHIVASLEPPLEAAREAMEQKLAGVTIADILGDIHRRSA